MKKTIFFVTCLFLSISVFGQVTFSPDKPQAGQTVTITYNPANGPLANSTVIKADAYYFTTSPMANTTPVVFQKEGSSWKATIEVKESKMVGFLMALRDSSGTKIDNNKDNGYYFLVHTTNGKIVEGARVGLITAGMAATRKPTFKLRTNYKQNVALFEEEFAENPSLKKKNLSLYLSSVAQSKQDGFKGKIKTELESLLASADADIRDLTMAANMYDRIGDSTNAEKYAKIIREKEPKGSFVQMERLNAVSAEKNHAKKIELFKTFETDIPNSMYLPMIASSIISSYTETKDIEGLKAHIAKYESKMMTGTAQKASMYNSVAWSLAEKDIDMALAAEYAQKSLELLKAEKDQTKIASPLNASKDTYGYILEKQGKIAEAYVYYKEAIPEKIENSSPDVNERYTLAAIKTGNTDDALKMGEQFIKFGKSTDKIRATVKELLAKKQSPAQAEAHIANLEKEARANTKNLLMKKMMNEPAPDFTLRDLKGNTVSLSGLKGKVVIVDFWATWCGPCIASFPGMQMAQNKYKDNPNVKFLFVDTWEKGDKETFLPKVAEFIAKNKYDFTVPLDTDSKVIADYKVDGIPTKFIIDGNGNIRFKAVGFSGKAETVVEELSAMIDALNEPVK